MRRAALLAVLAAAILAAPVWAQEEEQHDGIENAEYQTEETREINRAIYEANEEYGQLDDEIAAIEEEQGSLSGRSDIRPLELEQDDAEAEVRDGAEDLAEARLEAIREAPAEGAEEEQIAALEDKADALDTLASYSSDWVGSSFSTDLTNEIIDERDAVEGEIEALEAPPDEDAGGSPSSGDSGSSGGGSPSGSDSGSAGGSSGSDTSSTGTGISLGQIIAVGVLGLIGIAVLLSFLGVSLSPILAPLAPILGIAAVGYVRRRRQSKAEKAAFSSQGIHTVDPNAPAAIVREVSPEEAARAIGTGGGKWHALARDYDTEHVAVHAGTGSGKNQTILNELAWDVISARPESTVILDAKADMLNDMAPHTPGPQFIFSAIPPSHNDTEDGRLMHSASSALNLVGDPAMTAATAAALYPTEGQKNPIFNQTSRGLFEGIADALGHSDTNIYEIYQVLQDEPLLKAIAEKNPRVKRAMPEGKDFKGSVLGSATAPLAPLENWNIARMFIPAPGAKQPDFRSKQTVWICVPPDPDIIASFGPLAGALVAGLNRIAMQARRPGVRMIIDEAASFLTIEQLDSYLSLGRGQGVRWAIVLQDISQLIARLGEQRANTVLGNIGLHLFGAGASETNAEWVSHHVGNVTTRQRIHREEPSIIRKIQELRGEDEWDIREEQRKAILPEHIMELQPGSWFTWRPGPRTQSGVAGEIVHGAYWYQYMHAVLGPQIRPQVLGLGPDTEPGQYRHPGDEARSTRPSTPPPADTGTPTNDAPEEPTDTQGGEEEPKTTTEPTDAPESGPEDSGDMYPPEMESCPSCQEIAPPQAAFCPSCGGRLGSL